MMGYFPDPYPDELLYSVLARFSKRTQHPYGRNLGETLFGNQNAVAVIDLPCRLDAFTNRLPPGHHYNVDMLINHHTLFPLYVPFLPGERVERLRQEMRGENGSAIHMRSGIMASTIPMSQSFKYCLECMRNDRNRWGEGYWHRVHQAPGVEVCPEHRVWLEHSPIPIHNMRVRHMYVAADEIIQPSESRPLAALDCRWTVLVVVAQDAAWLLERDDLTAGLGDLRERYLRILADMGWATYRGRLRMRQLIRAFIDWYPASLLKLLHCELDELICDNWLARLIRSRGEVSSPVQHLLLIQFLGLTARSFFNRPKGRRLFGEGPWPCLNPVCRHYLQPHIQSYQVTYPVQRDGRPTGQFTCDCGYTYTRKGPDNTVADNTRIGRILAYGELWEYELKRLWLDPAISVRAAARRLGVDSKTVKRQAERLGLCRVHEIDWSPAHAAGDVDRAGENVRSEIERRRSAWLSLIEAHPETGVKALRRQAPGVYAWLYRHDRIWLQDHRPICGKRETNTGKTRVDWHERDQQLAEEVDVAYRRLCSNSGRPIRLTVTTIGRETGQLPIIQKHPDRLPITMQKLCQFAETREGYAVRRIQWVTRSYVDARICPKAWQLIRQAGVTRLVENRKIREALDAALNLLGVYQSGE